MPTVREIAELAGVSISTVSLVLNNRPGVSEEMRRIVLDARQHLDAQQGTNADAPSATVLNTVRQTPNRMLSLVVLHPPVVRSNYVFSEVMQGIQSAAETYLVQLRFLVNDPDATGSHVTSLMLTEPSLRPDGVLIFGAKQYEPLLVEAERQGIPCVVLGRNALRYKVSGVGREEERYAFEATRYLLELGHRAIGFIGGDEAYDFFHTRVKGYRSALADAGIDTNACWVQMGDGAEATEALLKQAPEVTATLYINDTAAQQGLPVMQAQGLRIPQDMSIISFDDTDFAQLYEPPLTSISYRRFEEGQWAVKMLIDQIRYPHLDRVYTLFKAHLIVRDSCAEPRA